MTQNHNSQLNLYPAKILAISDRALEQGLRGRTGTQQRDKSITKTCSSSQGDDCQREKCTKDPADYWQFGGGLFFICYVALSLMVQIH
ncbi:hypothetical protein MATL_G00002800 [Megalops atlanticus]|uniref:Uncharacterized protein n=1 Tax=Megalops atlanticus TaxID=7932 RepID=A0A9D3QEN2_MEGAT|nr:hypothetical protein MATL_G00002800 [Megalops atlanticus]